MLLCGNIVAHISSVINKANCGTYQFVAEYKVYEDQTDSRRDKRTDYAILKLFNQYTVLIMELKANVGIDILSVDRTLLAQLMRFVEANQKEEKKIVAVYGNYTVMHIFIINTRTPFACEKYCTIEPQHTKVTYITDLFLALINSITTTT